MRTIPTFDNANAFIRSYDPTSRNSDAVFLRVLRELSEDDPRSYLLKAAILGAAIVEDITNSLDRDSRRFNEIGFDKRDSAQNNETYSVFHPNLNGMGKYLDIHMRTFDNSSLGSIKRSMAAASPWLKEVAEEYPTVLGCTYSKLATTAFRCFGFEGVIGREDLDIAPLYEAGIEIYQIVFDELNGRATPSQSEIACVYARTEHLAEVWGKY